MSPFDLVGWAALAFGSVGGVFLGLWIKDGLIWLTQ